MFELKAKGGLVQNSKFTIVISVPLVASLALITGCAKKESGLNTNPDSNQALVQDQPAAVDAKFGVAQDLGGGIKVTFSEPIHFVPGKFASNYEKPQIPNKFDVTITNNGTTPIDPASVSLTATSAGKTCVDVLDGDNNLMGAPTDPVAAGKSVTFGYGVACLSKIGEPLDVRATFADKVVSITGTLK